MDGLVLHASIHSSMQRKRGGGGVGVFPEHGGPALHQASLLRDILSWKLTTLQ